MQTSVLFHYIHILNCLPPEDAGGSRRVFEYLEDLTVAEGTAAATYHETPTALGLRTALRNIAKKTNLQRIPLIHIDAHADKNRGLEFRQGNSKPKYLSWTIVTQLLREININTQNRLFVVFCACSAFSIITELHPRTQAHFSVCVSPYSALTLQQIEDTIPIFYRNLMVNYDFVEAIAATREAYQYTSSELFLKDLLITIVKSTIGKEGKKRREAMLTEAIRQSIGPMNLKNTRKEIRDNWTLTDSHIEQLAMQYLGGRDIPYTAAEIKDEARKAHEAEFRA